MLRNKRVPKIAAIHDMSCYGRASLTLVIPTLSSMGVQVCPLPTAILSTHTGGFEGYTFLDLTEEMLKIITHWKKLKLEFDCVYSGYLGSPRQVEIVEDFIDSFGGKEKLVIIDPVLGDEGIKYDAINEDMVRGMKKLIGKAQLITPNYTEICLLFDDEYKQYVSLDEIKTLIKKAADLGPGQIVVTSVPLEGRAKQAAAIAYDVKKDCFWLAERPYVAASYPGTGDIFTSVIAGALLNGEIFPRALGMAADFIHACLRTGMEDDAPIRDGIALESMLNELSNPSKGAKVEII